MKIIKRSGEIRDFDLKKIEVAMQKAFISVGKPADKEKIHIIAAGCKPPRSRWPLPLRWRARKPAASANSLDRKSVV